MRYWMVFVCVLGGMWLGWRRSLWADGVEALEIGEELEGYVCVVRGNVSQGGKRLALALELDWEGKWHSGPKHSLEVGRDGGFNFILRTSKQILRGRYRVVLYEGSQRRYTSRIFSWGRAEQIQEERQKFLDHLRDLFRTSVVAVREVIAGGEFFIRTIAKYSSRIKRVRKSRLEWIRHWKKVEANETEEGKYTFYLHRLLEAGLRNLKDLDELLYLNPCPEVRKDLEYLLKLARQLVVDYTNWLILWSYRPKELESVERDIGQKIYILSKIYKRLAKALRIVSPVRLRWRWLERPSEFRLEGKDYVEKWLKIRLSFSKRWRVSLVPIGPRVRLCLISLQNPLVRIYLEVNDYPLSRSYRDLRMLTVVQAQEGWPGFQKVESFPITLKLQGEVRHGFHFVFLTRDDRYVIGGVYKNRVYQIFGKDKKRVYTLRLFAPSNVFESFQKEFETLIQTFRVP
ncbi:MAG: hypothetical protein D6805_00090 [Planctomycetota bacterium]|nr:MAG: hypothetical protein D6805_00090 [Planctomycetota bacterium]